MRKPPSFTEAVSRISPFSEIAFSNCRARRENSCISLPYSARFGLLSLSLSKKIFNAPNASALARMFINSSTSNTLPIRARFTASLILYSPPKGKRFPSSNRRLASAVSICKRFTVSNSAEIRSSNNCFLPSSVAVFSAARSFTLSNSSVVIANRAILC